MVYIIYRTGGGLVIHWGSKCMNTVREVSLKLALVVPFETFLRGVYQSPGHAGSRPCVPWGYSQVKAYWPCAGLRPAILTTQSELLTPNFSLLNILEGGGGVVGVLVEVHVGGWRCEAVVDG